MWRYGLKYVFWFLVLVAILSAGVLLLWNWLIPELFNGKMINYWQALGILALARLLTGIGRVGSGHMKHKIASHWHALPREEKEELRKKFRDKWCRVDSSEESETK